MVANHVSILRRLYILNHSMPPSINLYSNVQQMCNVIVHTLTHEVKSSLFPFRCGAGRFPFNYQISDSNHETDRFHWRPIDSHVLVVILSQHEYVPFAFIVCMNWANFVLLSHVLFPSFFFIAMSVLDIHE